MKRDDMDDARYRCFFETESGMYNYKKYNIP